MRNFVTPARDTRRLLQAIYIMSLQTAMGFSNTTPLPGDNCSQTGRSDCQRIAIARTIRNTSFGWFSIGQTTDGQRDLRPIVVINVGENIVQWTQRGRARLRPRCVVVSCSWRRDEAQQMVLDAFARVIGAGAGAQDERPVARLGEKQFAAGLFERAQFQAASRSGNFRASSVMRSCAMCRCG